MGFGCGASRRILVGQILMGRRSLGVYLNDDVGSVDDLGGGGRRTRADEDGGHVELNDSNEWWSSGRKGGRGSEATLSWLAPRAPRLGQPARPSQRPALAPSQPRHLSSQLSPPPDSLRGETTTAESPESAVGRRFPMGERQSARVIVIVVDGAFSRAFSLRRKRAR